MFRIGMKVVCVDTFPKSTFRSLWQRFRHPYPSPVKGRVYTVTGFDRCQENQLHLDLAELRHDSDFWCAGYLACGFRPVAERKTDIGVFTAMLDPAPRKDLVDSILAADSAEPEASFNNVHDMLEWLNR